MKKLVIILMLALALVTWGPEAYSDTPEKNSNPKQDYSSFIQMLIETKKAEDLRIKNEEISNQLKIRNEKIDNRILELHQYVGQTRYVFSGSTPSGWDCSGMVLWFYKDLGFDLEHSATKQMLAGTIVEEPLPGDIVSFSNNGGKNSYHNGIYIGNGLFIHSPRPGFRTKIASVEKSSSNSTIVYTRIF
jgi:cell wall-associated NlpC family hydrolase